MGRGLNEDLFLEMFLINSLLRSLSFTISTKRYYRNVVFLLSKMLTLMLLNIHATFQTYETSIFCLGYHA